VVSDSLLSISSPQCLVNNFFHNFLNLIFINSYCFNKLFIYHLSARNSIISSPLDIVNNFIKNSFNILLRYFIRFKLLFCMSFATCFILTSVIYSYLLCFHYYLKLFLDSIIILYYSNYCA
ncbi:MAG: hypothetical protein A370_02777, partial [Clostridium sp. Maddingley MBC34-26]